MKRSVKHGEKISPNQVLRALDQTVLDMFEKLKFEGQVPTEEQRKLGLKAFKLSPAYAEISRVLQRGSDTDREHAERIIQKKFPSAFRKPLLNAVRGLPHPKGGHPELLSDDAKRKACDEIVKLIRASGLEKRDAFERVATHFGTSVRTMQRIWRLRKNYAIQSQK
jgi:hypothetical protein